MDAEITPLQPLVMDGRLRQRRPQMPDVLEVEPSTPDTAGLLRALAHRHGELIASAARSLTRMFLLRGPWAPGLRFAGGLVTAASADASAPESLRSLNHTLSVGGGGASIEDALASCIGEAVERLSQFKRPADIAAVSTISDVHDRLLPGVRQRVAQLCSLAGHDKCAKFDWIEGISGITQAKCLIPADWCLRSGAHHPLAVPGAALSTGVAAGPTFEAAALRAILELIERDAVALWWIGGRRARAPTLDAALVREAHDVLSSLRQGNQDRVSWILDLTSDLHVPVMAALSVCPDGRGLACGFGARLTAKDAARAAIYELCQMELGLNLAEAREATGGAAKLSDDDRAKLSLARDIDTESCALLHPSIAVASGDAMLGATQDEGSFSALLRYLSDLRIEVALVDLTRAEFAIPVVAAVAPGLQLMPAQFLTKRLDEVIAEAGGGRRFTNNLMPF